MGLMKSKRLAAKEPRIALGVACLRLTHWGRDKMAAISQTTLSNPFSWMEKFEFRLKFHWSWFPRVQSTRFQHWFRYWIGADQATSHYLNQWWLDCWRLYASLGLNELTWCTRIIGLHSQKQGYWWPGDARRLGINMYDINVFLLEYSITRGSQRGVRTLYVFDVQCLPKCVYSYM